MRLKHRLTVTLVAVTAAALSGSFAAVAFLVQRDETTDLDRAVSAQAHATAYLAVQKDPTHPSVIDGQGEAPEVYSPTQRYVAIYGPDGSIVAATRSFHKDLPTLESLGLHDLGTADSPHMNFAVNGSHLRGVVVPIGDGRLHLLYAISRRSVDDDMRFLFKVFALLFLGATAVTTLVARLLGSRLARDVDAIADVARQVAGGDLSARVEARARGSTETRALGKDLDHMIGQLADLVMAQQVFVSHAAHELRSPLATLRGELQLAMRRPRTAEEYKAFIEDALAEVESLASLAEDLLVLARVQRKQSDTQATYVGDALAEAVRMARGAAEEAGIRIVEPGETSLQSAVRGARADVARALRNLLENAVEHSPPGGEVRVRVEHGPEIVRVSVTDQGAGVAAEDAPHIFSPFYRGAKDRSGDTRGTGLGLAIVREIARAYGGDVLLDASFKGGARFVLELPVASHPPDPRESMPPASRPPPPFVEREA